jgi:hypothetical protein
VSGQREGDADEMVFIDPAFGVLVKQALVELTPKQRSKNF